MKGLRQIYNITNIITALFMTVVMLWLTVSLPLVNKAQQTIKAAQAAKTGAEGEDSCNPFGNTTEEKNPNSNNTIAEEFLHESHSPLESHPIGIKHNKCTHPAVYVAFHGELLSPPPEG